ncbi:Gamma-aminobutyric acid type B receptor subunit 2 [Acropora cervicornis]|uniref:Gamma-aminobutyric acid type B receptor subunit 2 n=1 Tax=Acropora cervicornis TaxID=6130 RepID=A0AAD9R0P8_ACRCE|nr:Gamma-aminobutyric acid type B receptor subunit 2 [Acropora cervicornis]
MAVYNVCTICAIGVPLALVIYTQHHNLYFYVVAISIVSCTTLTLCLVFVPKIRSLKKSNTSEASGIFPTNGLKYKKRFLKGGSKSLTTKELGNEIEWLQGQNGSAALDLKR